MGLQYVKYLDAVQSEVMSCRGGTMGNETTLFDKYLDAVQSEVMSFRGGTMGNETTLFELR